VRKLNGCEVYGLLQFTCGLPTPTLSDGGPSAFWRAVTVGDVRERRRSLRSWLMPLKDDFRFDGLTEIDSTKKVKPEHTWLLDLSRHAARQLSSYSPRPVDGPPPPGFPGALDWHRPDDGGRAPWKHFLRVQRARDDSSYSLTAETDCNDYLIRDKQLGAIEPGSLWELQLFFCEFQAQRRGAIFASHVSERIYSIWLPPGVVIWPPGSDYGQSWFAILPVVTVVRRPYRIDWRYAMSLSVLFVPQWPDGQPGPLGSNSPRPVSPGEVFDVLTSTGGNSTFIYGSANIHCDLDEKSPLHAYLTAITDDKRRDFCSRYTAAQGRPRHDEPKTLRHWIELMLLTAADLPKRPEDRVDDRIVPEYERADDRILPDEVLRCLRVNSMWSATLLTDDLQSCEGSSLIAGGRWWPAGTKAPAAVDDLYSGVPRPIVKLFESFAGRSRAFPPTPDDRVDVLATGGLAHMTWRIPGEHIIVTAYRREADEFPSLSSLNLVGWFAYMAVGVTCAWQTMYSLTHDTDKLQDVAKLSQLVHDRILDLEDVYDLDVAWPAYAEFYSRLRSLLGVEREYNNIKDRLELLFRFAQAEQRFRGERNSNEQLRLRSREQQLATLHMHTVELAAAIAGACILLVSVMILLVTLDRNQMSKPLAYWILGVVVAAGVGYGLFLRSRVRGVDAQRAEVIRSLAQLAPPPESPPADGATAGATPDQRVTRGDAKRELVEG
jgi:hypothetical protein